MFIIRVAIDVPVDTLFDYLVPEIGLQDIGVRVRVPFGKKAVTGVVMEIIPYSSGSRIPSIKLKPAIELFRDIAPLPEPLLNLFRFCNTYYHHPIGQVVMNGLPGRLREGKPFVKNSPAGLQYRLTDAGRKADVSSIPVRRIVKRRLLARLGEGAPLCREEIKQSSVRALPALNEFLALGWVEEEIISPPILPIYPTNDLHGPNGAKRTAAVADAAIPALTGEQQCAFDAIAAQTDRFKPWLLHGITGSGKTEVYLRLISLLLRQGRQTLVLVPEINLTPQLEAIFRSRFPAARLISLHSGLNASARAAGWVQAQQGNAEIVLGTRLAVFTPMPGLGMVIVDEEQDTSFKQQEGLRYSARDVAIFRAKQAGIPIILGSATPSLESYYNSLTGRYSRLRLTSRAVSNAVPPVVRCIDARTVKIVEGLSEPLIAALEKRLAVGEQSLVFLNRRGYAPVLWCGACGWIAPCHRCSSRLVVHLREGKLCCHHCGHEERFPNACPECGNQDLAPYGHGTQRIETALERRLPNARIMRIDRDSIRRKNAWQHMLKDIQEQRIDILVGTQILAKGHDFPNLSLVAILNSDASLFSTDFRASERAFAQLMQVGGRAGRANIPGEVLVQTEFPAHPLYEALKKQDYDSLAQVLLAERKNAGFPPFVHQALLRAEAQRIDIALDYLARAAAILNPSRQVNVFDPVPAQMTRLRGMERAYLLIQSSSRGKLQEFLAAWRVKLAELPGRKVRWSLDVDPVEF
ncbi:MAG TPA: primosomal protein N' [Nitrosospira sp.]|nr:primosomal protein N' [Nitrosospira sp.]